MQHTANSVIGAAIKLLPSESPILCLQVDRPTTALHLAKLLRQAGIFAPAIRPPTVPTSRLRLNPHGNSPRYPSTAARFRLRQSNSRSEPVIPRSFVKALAKHI